MGKGIFGSFGQVAKDKLQQLEAQEAAQSEQDLLQPQPALQVTAVGDHQGAIVNATPGQNASMKE